MPGSCRPPGEDPGLPGSSLVRSRRPWPNTPRCARRRSWPRERRAGRPASGGVSRWARRWLRRNCGRGSCGRCPSTWCRRFTMFSMRLPVTPNGKGRPERAACPRTRREWHRAGTCAAAWSDRGSGGGDPGRRFLVQAAVADRHLRKLLRARGVTRSCVSAASVTASRLVQRRSSAPEPVCGPDGGGSSCAVDRGGSARRAAGLELPPLLRADRPAGDPPSPRAAASALVPRPVIAGSGDLQYDGRWASDGAVRRGGVRA